MGNKNNKPIIDKHGNYKTWLVLKKRSGKTMDLIYFPDFAEVEPHPIKNTRSYDNKYAVSCDKINYLISERLKNGQDLTLSMSQEDLKTIYGDAKFDMVSINIYDVIKRQRPSTNIEPAKDLRKPKNPRTDLDFWVVIENVPKNGRSTVYFPELCDGKDMKFSIKGATVSDVGTNAQERLNDLIAQKINFGERFEGLQKISKKEDIQNKYHGAKTCLIIQADNDKISNCLIEMNRKKTNTPTCTVQKESQRRNGFLPL